MFINFSIKRKSALEERRSYSDEELVEEYRKKNDSQIITLFFDRYIHLVFAGCMKYLKNTDLAKDAAMEIFENLHLKLEKHEIRSFKSWLYILMKNHCLMILRKKKIVINDIHLEKMSDFYVEFEPVQHPKIEQENRYCALLRCLSTLKKEQQVCLEMMYLKDYSYKEISEQTGYSLKKVKSCIQNGKRRLRILLEGTDEFKEYI